MDSKKEIKVKISDEKLKGVYSNLMRIYHTKEEFILDFLSVFEPSGTVVSRIIVSPPHLKRIIKALKENIEKYEKNYDKIKETTESQPEEEIGFKV